MSYNFTQNIVFDLNTIPYFLAFCLYIRIFLYLGYTFLKLTNNKFYLLNKDRKQYVVKNIVKSINLGALSLYSIPCIIYPAFMYQTWNNKLMHIAGLFYSSNDFVALLYVDNLSSTTKNHHKVTVVLSFLALGIDYTTSTLGRMLFIYTLASSYAFLVNYYLGSRFLYDKYNKSLVNMKKNARNVYALSLFLNWNWHIYWCLTNFNLLGIQHLLYFGVMIPVVKDDIVLLTWLCN